MTPIQKIEKAKVKLMLEQPYIGSIATLLELKPKAETLTFHSDGVTLTYNSEYVEKAPLEELSFALANGAMHAVLKHKERENRRVGRLWQTASDLVVNSMLVKNGFVLPPYAFYDDRFEGMYAEEIYDVLQDEVIQNDSLDDAEANAEEEISEEAQQKENQQESQKGETALNTLKPTSIQAYDMVQSKELSTEQEMLFEQLFEKYKRQGTLPENLHIVVPEYFSHKVDWREILSKYIASYAKSTYAFIPPNMKYLYRGISLPSLSSDLLRIVIAIDTSGSIDEILLGTFLGEVDAIMQGYPNYEIDLITADAKIQSHQVFLPGEALSYELSGGGGTDFRPVFEYIEYFIDYPTLLLYFTDGEGTFPQNEPRYDLLWIMPTLKEVPVGEVVVLGTDKR